jgi:hypothetical protein
MVGKFCPCILTIESSVMAETQTKQNTIRSPERLPSDLNTGSKNQPQILTR